MIWQPVFSKGFIVLFALLWILLLIWGFFRSKGIWAFIRRALLGGVLLVAMLGPSAPAEEESITSNVEIYLAIDRTGSMAAEDWEGNQPRLEGVKRDIMALVESTAGARYSIISWDSAGRLELPLTTDGSAVESYADTLHQEITQYSSASSLNRPLLELEEEIIGAANERPQNSRFLVVFTDGENTAEESQQTLLWGALKKVIDGGAVIGYGTAEGGPMKVYDPALQKGGFEAHYMTDASGNQAISHMDEKNLRQMADQLGVEMLLNPSVDQMQKLGGQIMDGAKDLAESRKTQRTYRLLVWPFATAGSILIAWELAALVAELTRLRRTNAI